MFLISFLIFHSSKELKDYKFSAGEPLIQWVSRRTFFLSDQASLISYHTFKSLSRTLNINLKYPKDKTTRILTTNFLFPLRKIFRLFTLVKDLAVRLLLCLNDKTIKYGEKRSSERSSLCTFFFTVSFLLMFLTSRFLHRYRKSRYTHPFNSLILKN